MGNHRRAKFLYAQVTHALLTNYRSIKVTTAAAARDLLDAFHGAGKSFGKRAIVFGDGVAGMTGVAALGWFQERFKIEASLKNLDAVYDAKYQELIAQLQKSLKEVAQCESS